MSGANLREATPSDRAAIDALYPLAFPGEDLLPLLGGEGRLDRDAIHWHYPNFAFHKDNRLGSAVRMGDFKLIEFFDDNSVELYDLTKDIGEKKDLAKELPDKAKGMQTILQKWRKDSGAAMPRPREGAL